MAAKIEAGRFFKDGAISESAGIRPHKIDLNAPSEAEFLRRKSRQGENSASAEKGDCFYHTGENALWCYNGSNWERELKGGQQAYLEFRDQPFMFADGAAFGAPTGTGGDENYISVPGGLLMQHVIGTQTILGPSLGAQGLDISQDLVNNDGVELVRSGITARSPFAFTVGTSPAFYSEVKIYMTDVSGSDAVVAGFRKLEAFQAAEDDYDELAGLKINAGAIYGVGILNNAATDADDTTDTVADTASVTLKTLVSAAGVVTHQIDGADPTTAPSAFTFDNAEVLVPFVYLRHDSDVAEATQLVHWDCGLQ